MNEAIVQRYARALADVAQERKLDLKLVDAELRGFLATWQSSEELQEAFKNPSVALKQKVAVLDKIKEKIGLGSEVRNFVAVLTEHGRISAIANVVAAFEHEVKRRSGIQQAEVTTTRTLKPEEREGLIKGIEKLAGSKVEASFTEDKGILGGAIVRIGSTVYDGSVKGRLDRLKEALAG